VTRYLTRRLLQTVPLVLVLLVVNFLLIHAAPGDPIVYLAGQSGDQAYYEEQRARYGLDRPNHEQLGRYLLSVAQGELGYSFAYNQPVLQVILSRLPATLLLMLTALAVATLGGLQLGLLAAQRPGSLLDLALTSLAVLGNAIPAFFLGQLLIILLAGWLGWFPVQGMVTPRGGYTGFAYWLDVLHHLVLPAATLGTLQLALVARLSRQALLEALSEDYVRTARAKGLPPRRVLHGHALRNALLPVVTVVGGQVGTLVTGAVLTEIVFAWPGLGRLLFESTLTRDYPLLMALFLLLSATVTLANLLTDLVYTVVDPRVRYA
jgi:peptide/nickel transport system permease protein